MHPPGGVSAAGSSPYVETYIYHTDNILVLFLKKSSGDI